MEFTAKKIIVLGASLGIYVCSWVVALPTLADGLTTGALGGLGIGVFGIILAWIGESPIKPKG